MKNQILILLVSTAVFKISPAFGMFDIDNILPGDSPQQQNPGKRKHPDDEKDPSSNKKRKITPQKKAIENDKLRKNPNESSAASPIFDDLQLGHILNTYKKLEQEAKAALDIANEQNPLSSYDRGIGHAFNIYKNDLTTKEERFKKTIECFEKAAFQEEDPNSKKASYCLAIFYAMGWTPDDQLYTHKYNQQRLDHYLRSSSSYKRAKKLLETYKKTPLSFSDESEKDYKSHEQQFAKMLKTKRKEDEFKLGIFKAFGWGIPQDIEEAVTHLRNVSSEDEEDAAIVLKLLSINENITTEKENDVTIDIFNDCNIFLKKQEPFNIFKEIESIKTTANKILNQNNSEKISNTLQENTKMEIEDDTPLNKNHFINEKTSFDLPLPKSANVSPKIANIPLDDKSSYQQASTPPCSL